MNIGKQYRIFVKIGLVTLYQYFSRWMETNEIRL
jgi:hypothetical protein